MPSSRLATLLDEEMLARRGVQPANRSTPDDHLDRKSGSQVADELGGRYLLRYLLPEQLGSFTSGSGRRHWLTPTPFAPEETVTWLGLWQPGRVRTHVMLLNPERIDEIWGPRAIRFGGGIEYLLPNGFAAAAVMPVPEVMIS